MEECTVCGEHLAEYTCTRCDEYVCEDCCVAMTIHNQIDETCCHNCMPDEPTIGDFNKPLNLKTMEYLTELKIGTELPVEVLDKYMRDSYNFSYKSDGQFERATSGISALPAIRIVNALYSDRFVVTKTAGAVDLYYKLSEFTEFYNKFYNLTPKAMNRDPKRLEDWHNCVFYFNSADQAQTIIRLLRNIGFDNIDHGNSGYIRTNKRGIELSNGIERTDWYLYLTNPTEFEPEEAIAALSGKSTQYNSSFNFKKGEELKIWIGDDLELYEKVY